MATVKARFHPNKLNNIQNINSNYGEAIRIKKTNNKPFAFIPESADVLFSFKRSSNTTPKYLCKTISPKNSPLTDSERPLPILLAEKLLCNPKSSPSPLCQPPLLCSWPHLNNGIRSSYIPLLEPSSTCQISIGSSNAQLIP